MRNLEVNAPPEQPAQKQEKKTEPSTPAEGSLPPAPPSPVLPAVNGTQSQAAQKEQAIDHEQLIQLQGASELDLLDMRIEKMAEGLIAKQQAGEPITKEEAEAYKKAEQTYFEGFVEQYLSRTPWSRTIHEGDPKVGTVNVIGDTHKRPGSTRRRLANQGIYQGKELAHLLATRPQHVFIENYTPEWLASAAYQQRANEIRRTLSDEQGNLISLNRVNENQLVHLGHYGAGAVYAAFHPNVTVHGTVTSADWGVIEKYHEKRIAEGERNPYPETAAKREKLAIKELMDFLEKNPGSTVALIYGSAHGWGPEDFPEKVVESARLPQMNRIEWPGLRHSTEYAGRVIGALGSNPELQNKLIQKAIKIPIDAFSSISTEEGQLRALPKVYGDKMDRSTLIKRLLDGAVSDQVRDVITAGAEPGRPPRGKD